MAERDLTELPTCAAGDILPPGRRGPGAPPSAIEPAARPRPNWGLEASTPKASDAVSDRDFRVEFSRRASLILVQLSRPG